MGQNLASSRCNTGAGFSSMRRTTYSPAALGNHAHARQMTRLEGSKSFRVARAACPTELRAALRGKAAQTSQGGCSRFWASIACSMVGCGLTEEAGKCCRGRPPGSLCFLAPLVWHKRKEKMQKPCSSLSRTSSFHSAYFALQRRLAAPVSCRRGQLLDRSGAFQEPSRVAVAWINSSHKATRPATH